ncbi:MAG: hypothetical protein ACOYOT_12290 [Bacteroidales bacterium]
MTPQTLAVKASLAKSLVVAFENCKRNEKLETLTDLYVQVNTLSNEIAFYDDEEELLTQFKFSPDAMDSDSEESAYDVVASLLRELIDTVDFEESIEVFELVKPFSLLVVDENFEHQSEVYILDAGEIVVEDSLFAGVDKELDDFLNHLLEE